MSKGAGLVDPQDSAVNDHEPNNPGTINPTTNVGTSQLDIGRAPSLQPGLVIRETFTPGVPPAEIDDASLQKSRHAEVPPKQNLNNIAANKKKKIRAAVSIYDDVSRVVGDPFAPTNDILIEAVIDGGRFGDPSLKVKVNIGIGSKCQAIPKDESLSNTAFISWYPSLSHEGVRSISQLSFHSVSSLLGIPNAVPASIRALCPTDKPNLLKDLVLVVFKSRLQIQDHYDPEWTKGLPEDVENGINELFQWRGERLVTVWFLNPLGNLDQYDRLEKYYLEPLKVAVETSPPSYINGDLMANVE